MNRNWQEVAITIHRDAQEALSEMLMNLGAKGVAIDDPNLVQEAKANRWGDYFPEIAPSDYVTVKAYYSEHKTDAKLEELKSRIIGLSKFGLIVGEVELSVNIMAEEDWANNWKAYYHTTVIDNVAIKPSWEEYTANTDQIVVNLDPGMAFGTGTHPSTAMCIAGLQDIDLTNKIVWDIGTGSGLLAITAKKLGAATVHAVDLDPVAIEVSSDNADRNKVEIDIEQGSIDRLSGAADVIIANIIADVIIEMLPEVVKKLAEKGHFLASGIIDLRADDVEEAAKSHGLVITNKKQQADWVFYCFKREVC